MHLAVTAWLVWSAPIHPGDYCSADDGARSWSPGAKARTRDRIRAACERVGGSPLYCELWDAAVVRESWGGVASAVHTLGRDTDGRPEYGLGPLGLSVRWHAGRLPGADPDPAFCSPEAAFIVAHSIAVDAVERYHASSPVEIQAIYGGGRNSRHCEADGLPSWLRWLGLGWLVERSAGRRRCWATPQPRHVRAVCSRMGSRCYRRITRADLGESVEPARRVAWAQAAARAFHTH